MVKKKDTKKKEKIVKKAAVKEPVKKRKERKVVVGKIVKQVAKPAIEKPKSAFRPRPESMADKAKPLKIVEKKEIWATGKRKSAIARVHFFSTGRGEIRINNKSVEKYFPISTSRQTVLAPLKLLGQEKNFQFIIKVQGGGVRGQAEAVRLGIARILESFNSDWRQVLKSAGFLRRDARIKERKKPGLKRARRAPQWSKR